MNQLVILLIEDEPDVRAAVLRDLEVFEPAFVIEEAESTEDARKLVGELTASGDRVALVLADHLLPGTTGTEFLVELHGRPETHAAHKVLLTGQAGHDDTITAVNQAGLDHYVAKPWAPDDLQAVVRQELTEYVLDQVDDLLPYVGILDEQALLSEIAHRGFDR
jgi:two-component system chemotaxis response regulator CheY